MKRRPSGPVLSSTQKKGDPTTMRPNPERMQDTWVGLGIRIAPETVCDEDPYCRNEAAWLWLALRDLGGAAPVVAVLAVLAREGYNDPEDILLEAMTDSSGGFDWYAVPTWRR